MAKPVIDNPILNTPYVEPDRHWAFDDSGVITSEVEARRRPSESWVPVPAPKKKGRGQQQEIAFEHTLERRRRNDTVDRVRQRVGVWRQRGYPNVTPTTKRLLEYWADPERGNKVLFAQREAVETAIYLAEAATAEGDHWIATELAAHNAEHNDGLPRIALKMATGSGKTVVMAMLIAWQVLNHVEGSGRRGRYAKRFLVVTPGITIRDRLRVLLPSDDENYYKQRDLVPADLWGHLRQADIVITNFHSFLLRTTEEGKGLASNTKALLTRGRSEDPFVETPDKMVTRVLRGFAGSGKGGLVVFNDEAHHCYRGRTTPLENAADTEDTLKGQDRTEARDRNRDAGVWFSGLQHVARKLGIKAVYDLSATPYFLKGSGYPEGYLFPWVVSDFALMDAIEAGIVKIPRVPVDDDATGDDVTYLRLWDKIGDELPKRLPKGAIPGGTPLPDTLEGALHSMYSSYRKAFEAWERTDADRGETPPVFIVVCSNTTVSKLVYDVIAGHARTVQGSEVLTPGELPLLSNVVDGRWVPRPRTILVDSLQLESGEALSAEFKAAAAAEIDALKDEIQRRYPGRDAANLEDADVLREVMNTVGKAGRIGEHVRCVVSVSMLTEGWDANTVTHIVGVRAFGSQLLCEQVVGRGLRRRSYTVNDEGYFDPEYAEVYGVPFAFVRVEPGPVDTPPRPTPVRVRALEDRAHAAIRFPKLDGYRLEMPDARLEVAFGDEHSYELTLDDVPTLTETAGVVGEQAIHDMAELAKARPAEVAFRIARRMLDRHAGADGEPKPWLFPDLVRIARRWLEECVTYRQGTFPGLFLLAETQSYAAERISQAVFAAAGSRPERVLPVFRRFDPIGSTDDVDFFTTKQVVATDPGTCPVNFVVLDGRDGNTWEQLVASYLESLPDVTAYVKNDHLEFAIPYVHGGHTRRYLPDFLVRLRQRPGDVERHLVVEVSGTLKSQAMTTEKAQTARNLWCAALNNHGGHGRWGFVEIADPVKAKPALAEAIAALYADGAVTGLAS